MTEQLTGVEPEAEEMMKAFPKNPVVCADIHSIAISLKKIAEAQTEKTIPLVLLSGIIRDHCFKTKYEDDNKCKTCGWPPEMHS